MENLSFETKNQSYREIIGNGKTYKVPSFQRDYSWEEEQWEELWFDVMALAESPHKNERHYLGYLVLKQNHIRDFDIVDGQQRITTLSLLILATIDFLKGFKTEDDTKRADYLRETYIGTFNVTTLRIVPKLVLNRNNKGYYEKRLTPLSQFESPKSKSDKRLLRAFQFFKQKLKDSHYIRDGRVISEFIENIADKLLFTVMIVEEESNAFKLFETLNARGVQLSSVDLLKNYLFSMASNNAQEDADIKHMESDWNTLTDCVQDKDLTQLVRYYWSSNYKRVPKKELFKEVKQEINTPQKAFELVRALEDVSTIFEKTKQPTASYWGEALPLIKEFNSFKVSQPYPAIFAGKAMLDDLDFQKYMKIINTLTFRYSKICGLNPNVLEVFYHDLALKLRKKELNSISEIKRFTKEFKVYPSDKTFTGSLEEKEFQGREKETFAKYILTKIEQNYSQGNFLDLDQSDRTLEHILPKNPKSDEWDYDLNDLKGIYLIGNLCLLKASTNHKRVQTFSQKKEWFRKDSLFHVNEAIHEEDNNWGYAEITKRTTELAKIAATIWKID